MNSTEKQELIELRKDFALLVRHLEEDHGCKYEDDGGCPTAGRDRYPWQEMVRSQYKLDRLREEVASLRAERSLVAVMLANPKKKFPL